MTKPKSKAARRPKGEGGYQVRKADGWVRGYKTFSGRRVWTHWCKNRYLASEALKLLVAPVAADERTIGFAVESFLGKTKLAASTRGGYEVSVRNYLAALLPLPVASLTRKDVAAHYVALAERGLASATIHQAANILKKGLDYAVESEWAGVGANVAARITLPSAPSKQVKGLAPIPRAKVLTTLVGHRYEARYRLGLLWALRPGEATGLTWDRVNLKKHTITVSGQLQPSKITVDGHMLGTIYRATTKSRAGKRTFAIDEETIRLLGEWRLVQTEERAGRDLTATQVARRSTQAARIERAKDLGLLNDPDLYSPAPDNLVFTLANGDPLLLRWDAALWRSLLVAAGVPHTRVYAGRHTSVNHLLVSGAPLLAVSVMAGHGSQAFTQRVYGGNLDAVTDGLAGLIDSQLPIQLPTLVTSSNIGGKKKE